jgi:SRSO17 transposase
MKDAVNNISSIEKGATLFSLVDTTPIECSLAELGSVHLKLVSDTNLESLWDYLVSENHYLGHKRFIGRRLKYLVFTGERPIAAIGWRSASLKLEARDYYIGWSKEQRKNYLKHIVNNNRFLIFDWVRVPHLASHILSRNIRVISKDWEKKYGHPIFLLETFVDPKRYRGTCYKASNWEDIGMTKGFTKKGISYTYHGNKKEVYVYVIEKDFRKIIKCQKKPYPQKPAHSREKERLLYMMIQQPDYDPKLIQWMDIEKDLISQLGEELISFHKEFHNCFYRIEQFILGQCYLKGLLSNLERKNIEAIALRYMEANNNEVRSLQKLMTNYRWSENLMLQEIQRKLSELIASEDGMITVDSSEFQKKGTESAGVTRQYCGNAGKIENCQSGVFVGYTSSKGYGLIDRQLYLPEVWFSQEYGERRLKCHVPEDLTFKTKIEIAFDLIEKGRQTGLFPARWLGADATFGSDSKFRDKVDASGMYFFVNIRSDTLVWLHRPEVGIPSYHGKGRPPEKERALESPVNVSKIASLSDLTWETEILAEGAKGPIIAKISRVRVVEYRDGFPGKELWLFLRKDPDGKTRYAFSNAPNDISIDQMKRIATMRWPIEQCFEDGKKHLGMDHYELRSWKGWHRHMTYVFMALLFLLKIRMKGLKKFHR